MCEDSSSPFWSAMRDHTTVPCCIHTPPVSSSLAWRESWLKLLSLRKYNFLLSIRLSEVESRISLNPLWSLDSYALPYWWCTYPQPLQNRHVNSMNAFNGFHPIILQIQHWKLSKSDVRNFLNNVSVKDIFFKMKVLKVTS